MRWKQTLAIAALAWVTACSGGSGSVTAPSPTPSPTPTPTPAASRYQLEAGGPLIGNVRFYESAIIEPASSNYSALGTDLNGIAYFGNGDALAAAFGPKAFVDRGLDNSLLGIGVDRFSGLPMNLWAPYGSSVASLVTSLLYTVDNQAAVKRALQLDTSFAFVNPNRDLRTFSWARALGSANADDVADARRLRAANVRLFAYLHAVELVRYEPPVSYTETQFTPSPADLGKVVKANPGIELFTEAGAAAVLRTYPRYSVGNPPFRDDVIAAAAHFLTLYSESIGPAITDDAVAASYMLATRAYLRRTLLELFIANSPAAAARVMAISAADISQAVAPYLDYPTLSTNALFPVPDFLVVPAGGTVTIPFDDPRSTGLPTLAGNDFTFFLDGGQPLKLDRVTLPARFDSAISVTMQADQSVVIQAKPGFTGVAWFEYDETSARGKPSATGRAYVTVR